MRASLEQILLVTSLITALPMAAYAESPAKKTELEPVIVTTNEEIPDGPKGSLIAQESSIGKSTADIMATPRSVSVITEQRMEDMGVQNVQDALLYTAGVYGAPYGDDTRGDWAIIRGSSPEFYVDGLKEAFGYYNNTRQDAYSLSRIEILKGPASVEYGQGTVGGIVNLVSKLPQEESFREVTAEYGSFNHKRLGGDVTGKIDENGEFLYRLVASVQDSDHQTDHVVDNRLSFNPSFTWRPDNDTNLTLHANLQDNESNSGTQFLPHQGTVFPAPNGDIPRDLFVSEPGYDRYDTNQQAVTFIGDHAFNDVWSIRGAVRYMHGTSEYYTMYPAFPPTINPDGRTINRWVDATEASVSALTSDIRVNGLLETGMVEHNLTAGIDYQDATTNTDSYFSVDGGILDLYQPVYGNIPTGVTLARAPSTNTRQAGIYVNNHMTIADHWIVALGLRGDEAETKTRGAAGQEDTAWTKNAGLMYRFDNGIAPYVSYAESFTPVIGADRNNNTYDPKEGQQYEVGVKYQPPGTQSIFTAALFDIVEENRLTSDPLDPLTSVQSGEVNIQGFELEGQTKWRDFDLLTNYTRLETEITESNDGDEGYNLADIPDHMFSAWVTWRPSTFWQGFRAGAGIRHVGSSWDGSDTFERSSYTLGDAMIGYEFIENWDVALNARNITDEEYLTSCLARGDCFLGEARTVMLSVTKRF